MCHAGCLHSVSDDRCIGRFTELTDLRVEGELGVLLEKGVGVQGKPEQPLHGLFRHTKRKVRFSLFSIFQTLTCLENARPSWPDGNL